MTFTPGQRVKTPRGRGVVVHYFPAPKAPQHATYSVRLPRRKSAVVFNTHELGAV